eukprot:scaffold3851_cov19-Tisochrysis_lutea.AAC.1
MSSICWKMFWRGPKRLQRGSFEPPLPNAQPYFTQAYTTAVLPCQQWVSAANLEPGYNMLL